MLPAFYTAYLNPIPKAELGHHLTSRKSSLTALPICPPPLVLMAPKHQWSFCVGGIPPSLDWKLLEGREVYLYKDVIKTSLPQGT